MATGAIDIVDHSQLTDISHCHSVSRLFGFLNFSISRFIMEAQTIFHMRSYAGAEWNVAFRRRLYWAHRYSQIRIDLIDGRCCFWIIKCNMHVYVRRTFTSEARVWEREYKAAPTWMNQSVLLNRFWKTIKRIALLLRTMKINYKISYGFKFRTIQYINQYSN